ncbi:MAG: hypothetical protein AB7O96_07225 [Pseudobdellovibrionaceae bacterium]
MKKLILLFAVTFSAIPAWSALDCKGEQGTSSYHVQSLPSREGQPEVRFQLSQTAKAQESAQVSAREIEFTTYKGISAMGVQNLHGYATAVVAEGEKPVYLGNVYLGIQRSESEVALHVYAVLFPQFAVPEVISLRTLCTETAE